MSLSALQPSHFGAMVSFALFISVAFASLGKHTLVERIRFALLSLALFLVVGVGIAWLLYPLSR